MHEWQRFLMHRYRATCYRDRMLWNDVSHFFEVDGSLRDIIVRETSVLDWETLISLSRQLGNVSYQADGEDAALPSAANLLSDKGRTHCMKVDLGGPVVMALFSDCEEMELDLDPREIGSQDELDRVLNFCSKLSLELERDVAITEEGNLEATLLSYSFPRRCWQIAGN